MLAMKAQELQRFFWSKILNFPQDIDIFIFLSCICFIIRQILMLFLRKEVAKNVSLSLLTLTISK